MIIAYYNIKSIDDVKAIYPNLKHGIVETISELIEGGYNIIIYLGNHGWRGFDNYCGEIPDFNHFEISNPVDKWIKYENVAKKIEEFLEIL